MVGVSGGAIRYVSPADTFVYEYDWRPDGRGFVATAAQGNGDNNWWIAKLVAVDLATPGQARVIAAPKMQMNFPRVSPDGRTVALIGGLMSDFGAVGGVGESGFGLEQLPQPPELTIGDHPFAPVS